MLRTSFRCVLILSVMSFLSATLLSATGTAEDTFSKIKVARQLASLEKDRSEALQKLAAHGDDEVTAELLITALDKDSKRVTSPPRVSALHMMNMLAKIDAESVAEALKRYLLVPNYKFAMVAAHEMGAKADLAMLDTFFEVVDTKNFKEIFGFRKTVVDAVLKIEDKRTVEFAVRLLPLVDGIVRYDLLQFLTQVTDQKFGNEEDHWTKWWADNKDDYEFAGEMTSLSDDDTEIEGFEASEYYGMTIYARRIVFVLDVSSSMWEDGPASPNTRFETAKKELMNTLQSLPDNTYFSMFAFNLKITPWNRGKMVKADDKTREAAIKWVQYTKWGKGTNSHGALSAAFKSDGNTEAIMFLSDGKPSKGTITNPTQILEAVKTENIFRKISIFSIGIFTGGGVDDRLASFMKNLASQNNGVYREVN